MNVKGSVNTSTTTSCTTSSSSPQSLKDPGIKLFGTKIPLSLLPTDFKEITKVDVSRPDEGNGEVNCSSPSGRTNEANQAQAKLSDTKQTCKAEPTETSNSSVEHEGVLKKPDKIIPCPRCNSLETKFCYFNNYNVNQPRHFCKNCQRYWTAGGTMRNVPIGAGRRKNKHLFASQFHQIPVENSELGTHQRPSFIESQTASLPSAGHNGLVLKFGPEVTGAVPRETPACDLTETIKHREPNPSTSYPPTPYMFPWNPMSSSQSSDDTRHFQLVPTQMLAVPLQLVPAPGWGPAVPTWGFTPGSVSLSGYENCNSRVSSTIMSSCTGSSTPTLGKHSRDSNCIVVPKTVRLNDPNEALKSPIWSTLHREREEKDLVPKDANFEAFEVEGNAGFLNTARTLRASHVVASRSHT